MNQHLKFDEHWNIEKRSSLPREAINFRFLASDFPALNFFWNGLPSGFRILIIVQEFSAISMKVTFMPAESWIRAYRTGPTGPKLIGRGPIEHHHGLYGPWPNVHSPGIPGTNDALLFARMVYFNLIKMINVVFKFKWFISNGKLKTWSSIE